MTAPAPFRPPRLDACPALVLNADYQPLSYFPLSLWGWQDAVKAMFLDRVAVVSYYDREIRSPSFRLRLPSVVALKEYVQQSHYPPFTRFNLFLRDRFGCQYCGTRFRAEDLTFDHVVPRSRGGQTSWDNIVTACTRCNLQKGNKLPAECGMPPRTKPRRPTNYELQRAGRAFPPNYLHESWRDFLYWDTELEP
ncbi:MAG: HNH endonuclease [Geminicoccaceae bacterium]|nr:MAG: HNH endonuclease [Geminicoccaceae bacterium]